LISRIILAFDAGSIFCKVALKSVFSTFGASGADTVDAATGPKLALNEVAAKGLSFRRSYTRIISLNRERLMHQVTWRMVTSWVVSIRFKAHNCSATVVTRSLG